MRAGKVRNPVSIFAAAWPSFWFRFGMTWLLVGLPFLLIAIALVINGRVDALVGIFGFMGLFFSAFGGIIFVRALRHTALQLGARHAGVTAQAVVTDVIETRESREGGANWRLRFEYVDHLGRAHSQTVCLSDAHARGWRAGDQATVHYDPDRPARAVWIVR